MQPKFIHLRVHSDYSLVEGLAKPCELLHHANTLNMPAIAITDYNNFYGVIKFYQAAYKYGIKPIIGIDVLCSSKIMKNENYKITLLAKNNTGYKNLIALISKSYIEKINNSQAIIKQNWLKKYHKGIIILSGGIFGDIGKSIIFNNDKNIILCLEFYKKYFANNFYIEITKTGRINELLYLNKVIKLSVLYNIPVVATNDVCFIRKNDFYAHKIRVAINQSCTLNSLHFVHNYSDQQYMRSELEMCAIFSDLPNSLQNSVEIAKRCNVNICLDQYFLPNFPTGIKNSYDFLKNKSKCGLKIRLKSLYPKKKKRISKSVKYFKRLYHELNVIKKMGFLDYFLIVMEFIQWAKNKNIPVGPGRGSGAGSLVAYALNITELDPITFKLLFERFLNPERVSMPDFDIDFCMEKRDKVIEHVVKRYGKKSVAQIITFGTMTAKAVIRDVGRVLGYPYGFINHISKLIPLDVGITLEKVLSLECAFTDLYYNDDEVKIIVNLAKQLEGVTRNVGKHAGGLVIAPTKIIDFVPVYCDDSGNNPVTQFDKSDIEKIGLVKFDFLGLRTLTIMHRTIKMINKKFKLSKKKKININSINLYDKNSFDLLRTGNTRGVFQLESLGIQDLIKRLQPDCFEDIVSLVALFRPGPLQSGMVDNFINRKNGREVIFYPDKKWQHRLLKPILQSTYGIILYQEQVMKIAQVLAGFTLGSADILRRAMSKKDIKDMNKQRLAFKTGAIRNGISSTFALKIFNLLNKFSGYGFNKSHSVAYALISYQTLWLKTHYPSQFLASVMTAEMDNKEKLIALVEEAHLFNIKIISPNINKSKYYFHVHDSGNIVYGLGAINGIGKNAIFYLIKERNINGKYINFYDILKRTDRAIITKNIFKKLIFSGAFDCLKLDRFFLKNNLEYFLNWSKQYWKNKLNKQVRLFIDENYELIELQYKFLNHKISWSNLEKLYFEREALGFYLTGNPINEYFKKAFIYTKGLRIKHLNSSFCNKKICVFGIISSIKIKFIKDNKRIAILIINDHFDKLSVIIYDVLLNKIENILDKDNVIVIFGTLRMNKFINKFNLIAFTCKIIT
ncbi:DNA polymerase III subunit alpha [Buchnera aphidicola (Mollitrichosiphum nigrofasciatum)]|uniref:DNA polymerase III subunit alpha n=1 Tax=Buchnera aphidicola TaxID=9 RepID=UPI0031B80FB9